MATPRAIWTGTIGVNLLQVPIKLCPAVTRDAGFSYLAKAGGAYVQPRQAYLLPDGTEAKRDDMVRGVQQGDSWIVVTPDEIEACAAEKSKTIGIDSFVPAADLDPFLFDTPYLVFPTTGGEKAYGLLRDALRKTKRAGVGRFVMRSKEYLVMVRVRGNMLIAQVVRYAESMVDTSAYDGDLANLKSTKDELAMAVQLVDALSGDFDHASYADTARENVRLLIEKKAAGQPVTKASPKPADAPAEDLIAALTASITNAKKTTKKTKAA